MAMVVDGIGSTGELTLPARREVCGDGLFTRSMGTPRRVSCCALALRPHRCFRQKRHRQEPAKPGFSPARLSHLIVTNAVTNLVTVQGRSKVFIVSSGPVDPDFVLGTSAVLCAGATPTPCSGSYPRRARTGHALQWPRHEDGQRSKQKGRRGKRQPTEDFYHNLLNLQLQGCMAPRNTRMAAGTACTRRRQLVR